MSKEDNFKLDITCTNPLLHNFIYLTISWIMDVFQEMVTGDIEVLASDITVLNPCRKDLPFQMHDFHKVSDSSNTNNSFNEG